MLQALEIVLFFREAGNIKNKITWYNWSVSMVESNSIIMHCIIIVAI